MKNKFTFIISKKVMKIMTLFLIASIFFNFTGCFGLTKRTIDETFGKKATIELKVIHYDLKEPIIYFIQEPYQTETVWTIRPTYVSSCEKIRIFAVTDKAKLVELSDKLQNITPIQLASINDEQNLWNLVSEKNCTILLTIGSISGQSFDGIFASSSDGIFQAEEITFQKDVPPVESGKISRWISLPLAPYFDLAVSPVASIVYFAEPEPGPQEMRITFEFPDGQQKSTTIKFDEAKKVLLKNFPHLFNWAREESRFARAWVRAGLLEFRIDFREECPVHNVYEQDPNMWHNCYFTSIGDYDGSWNYSVDGEGEFHFLGSLGKTLNKNNKEIRVFLEQN